MSPLVKLATLGFLGFNRLCTFRSDQVEVYNAIAIRVGGSVRRRNNTVQGIGGIQLSCRVQESCYDGTVVCNIRGVACASNIIIGSQSRTSDDLPVVAVVVVQVNNSCVINVLAVDGLSLRNIVLCSLNCIDLGAACIIVVTSNRV